MTVTPDVASPQEAALEAHIIATMRARVPGLSIAVVRPDGIRWTRGFGLADLRTKTRTSSDTVYLWFSMTKIVTATAVLQLMERGLLSLDDPAARYYPPLAALRPSASAERVTIRHLLSHSSGLANPIPVKWVRLAGEPVPDSAMFLNALLKRYSRLKFPPGSRASYSNLGFLVLGEVIKAVSRQPYDDHVRRSILVPLGMGLTEFSYSEAMMPRAARGYHPRWNIMTPLLQLMVPRALFDGTSGRYIAFKRFCVNGAAYGGLVGTADDAARFLRAHLSGGTLDGVPILSTTSTGDMQRLATHGNKMDVGLGWFRFRSADDREPAFVEHLGGGGGFFNVMRLYPGRRLGIVMMGNATSYDHEAIARSIIDQRW